MSQFSLAMIVIISALSITAYLQLEEEAENSILVARPTASYQIGDSVETLIAALGLPDDIDYGVDDMTWIYGDDSGLRIDLHHGIILGINGKLPRGRERILPDDQKPQLGQSVEACARLLGNPNESYSGQFGRQFNYANGWHVTYRFGRVVSCRKSS